MKKSISLLLLIVGCVLVSRAQNRKIEFDWVKADSLFIENVIKTSKANNPDSILMLFTYKGQKRDRLGFDYYLIDGSAGKGYVSIFYKLILHDDKVVSYKLEAQMPNDERLIERYERLYSPLFHFNNSRPEPLYYGYGQMTKPIDDNIKISTDEEILFFMTPYSGIYYGEYGGWGDRILDNRAAYNAVKKKITPQVLNLLLFSINPATRLSAIEYYYQNPSLFQENKKNFDQRVKTIFLEMPFAYTMHADIIDTDNAEDLVKTFVNKK